MRKVILVGISTILRFAGQFLFIKSISHLSETSILTTLNLQSLSVLIAGFSSGGIQTYLSRHIPIEKIKSVWALGLSNTRKYYLYSLISVLPFYFVVNKTKSFSYLTLAVVLISFILSFSNNWQGLLTGLKKYTSLISIFFIQLSLFLILYLFNNSIPTFFYYLAYPLVIAASFLISYVGNKSSLLSSGEINITKDLIREVSTFRTMGIVLMTVGVAYPFIIRNILMNGINIETVVNWDYLMRISTAYTSVSTFFIFTLFSSDLSQDNNKKNHFIIIASLMLVSYLSIFYLLNRPLIQLLLSREIVLSQTELLAFILFELVKSAFSLLCLYIIIKGQGSLYIILEITNLVLASLFLYFFTPAQLNSSFLLLSLCFFISVVVVFLYKHLSSTKNKT